MKRLLRLIVVCLLAVALPAQGYAAAGMLYCAPQHGSAGAEASAMPGHQGAARHDAGAPHQHADHDHAVERLQHPNGNTPAVQDHASQDTGCSVCAACCHGLAVNTVLLPTADNGIAAAPDSRHRAAHVDYLTDGPRRPPRRLPA